MNSIFNEVLSKLNSIPQQNEITVNTNDNLYHYTSANGILGILSSKTLELSNVKYLNDPNEIEYSKKLFLNVLDEIKLPFDNKINTSIKDLFIIDIHDYMDYLSDRVFIFSCSLDRDSLHLWNYYGRNDGYSLEFKVDDLYKSFQEQKFKLIKLKKSDGNIKFSFFIGKVIYDRDLQKELIIKYLTLFLELIIIGINNLKYDDALATFKEYRLALLALLLNYKEPYHSIESEFRVSILPDKAYNNIKSKTRGGIIVPYVSIINEKMKIKNIGIGPMIKDRIAQNGIEYLIKNYDLKCGVFKSGISIR